MNVPTPALHPAPSVSDEARRVLCRIESARRPLIVSHIRLDGDALGSALALCHLLRRRGASPHAVSDSAIPHIYRFLPGVEGAGLSPAALTGDYDLVIAVDTPAWSRTGAMGRALPRGVARVSIDHHLPVERVGDPEWTDTRWSSTGEMIYALARAGGWTIGPEAATCLYVALMTDTGRFTFPNTTDRALHAAGDLVALGAEHVLAADKVYQDIPFGVLRLRAEALAGVRLFADGRAAVMTISDEMLRRNGVDPIDTQEMADFPRAVAGVSVGVLLREMRAEGKVKVSLRARRGVNIEPAARALGGGGHREAAGAEPSGTLEEVEARVRALLERTLRDAPDT